MRPTPILLLALLASSCRSAPLDPAREFHGSVTALLGNASLGQHGWDGYDDPWALSASFTGQRKDWPVAVEFQTQYAQSNGPTTPERRDAEFKEFALGAARVWPLGSSVFVQAGGGLRIVDVLVTKPGFIFDDTAGHEVSPGLYLHAGIFYTIGPGLAFGADLRWADGTDVHIEGISRDTQLTQFALGLRWEL